MKAGVSVFAIRNLVECSFQILIKPHTIVTSFWMLMMRAWSGQYFPANSHLFDNYTDNLRFVTFKIITEAQDESEK